MTDENFGKMNMKIVKITPQCTLVPNISWFGKLQLLGPNLAKKYE